MLLTLSSAHVHFVVHIALTLLAVDTAQALPVVNCNIDQVAAAAPDYFESVNSTNAIFLFSGRGLLC